MRGRGYTLALVGSWVITAIVVLRTVVLGETTRLEDRRVAVRVTEPQLAFVETEMRDFLRASQQVLEAALRDDMDTVVASASRVGREPLGHIPPGLLARLPIGFKQLGFATHDAFRDLAAAAEAEDAKPRAIIEGLATIQRNCVACHAAYTMTAEAAE
jgi:hypothetical protein